MAYVIRGLNPAPFVPLYGASDADLATHGAMRMRVDATPGFPCRVTLEDADPGEDVLLVNFEHLPVDNPYRSRYAVFVREGATVPAEYRDAVPHQLAARLLSVRWFGTDDMLMAGEVIEGSGLDALLRDWLADPATGFVHVHNARPGCFAAAVRRA